VFESNPARRLYEELGWVNIGRVPPPSTAKTP
jgi:hypothetical protein